VPDLADVAARFSTLLHAAGVPVTPERAGRFASAVALAPPGLVSELYWLGRVTLVSDHAQIPVFDAVFASVFEGMVDPADFRGDSAPPPAVSRRRGSPGAPGSLDGGGPAPGPLSRLGSGGSSVEQETVAAMMSAQERLRHEDFARLTVAELSVLRGVTLVPPSRPSRRRVRHPAGAELDVRATLRRAGRGGGEPFVSVRRRRRSRPRRLVAICDISGSMEPYARAYLQLLWSGVSGNRAEAFVFATRLTRLTRAFAGVSPDAALARAGARAPDWSGGTRIGEALAAFNSQHGRRGLARGAVILILSDGWDTGDPALIGREMERLHRMAYRVVWVNPRKAADGFVPLVGGMAAALPWVDAFVSGHSLAALDEVLEAIAA
jgi:uncharacterized protein with von Willebrand factor type A (vWA) domain